MSEMDSSHLWEIECSGHKAQSFWSEEKEGKGGGGEEEDMK